MNSTKNLSKNSILYFTSMLIPKLSGFIMLPIYTQFLLPEEFGMQAYTSSIITILMIFSTLGLNTYYMREYKSSNNTRLFNGTIYWFLLIWNILLFSICVIIFPLFLEVLKAPVEFYPFMFMALITHFFDSMSFIPDKTFRIKGEVDKYFIRILFKTLFNVAFGVLFVVILKMGLFGRYLASMLNSMIFSIIFIVYMRNISLLSIDWGVLKKAIGFSIPIVPASLISKGTPFIVTIITERLLSVARLGIYSISLTVSSVVQIITTSLFFAIEPTLYTHMNSEGFPVIFLSLKKVLFVLVSIMFVLLGLYIDEAVHLLLSAKYFDAWKYIQIISFNYYLRAFISLLTTLVIIRGSMKFLIYVNIIELGANTIFSYVLFKIFGSDGLGWPSVIGSLLSIGFLWMLTYRKNWMNLSLSTDLLFAFYGLAIVLLSRFIHGCDLFIGIIIKTILLLLYLVSIVIIYRIPVKSLLNKVFN